MRTGMKASTVAFSETKQMFKDYLGKDKFEYDEYKHLSADCKAAALYLNFYDTIMANLYKARQHKPIPGNDQDLVGTAIDKCTRIIEVLDEQPEKYTKGYVALVMYNAFATDLSQLVSSKQKQFEVFQCLNFSETTDHLADIDWFEPAVDNTCIADEIRTDLLDLEKCSYSIESALSGSRFEEIIDNQPRYVQEIIEKIINGGKLGKKQQEIIPYLREIFGEFAPELADNLV